MALSQLFRVKAGIRFIFESQLVPLRLKKDNMYNHNLSVKEDWIRSNIKYERQQIFLVVSTLSLCCSISNYRVFMVLRTEEIKCFK